MRSGDRPQESLHDLGYKSGGIWWFSYIGLHTLLLFLFVKAGNEPTSEGLFLAAPTCSTALIGQFKSGSCVKLPAVDLSGA